MCQFTAVSVLLSGLHLEVEGGGRGRENNIALIALRMTRREGGTVYSGHSP